jgi:hypothetical protein
VIEYIFIGFLSALGWWGANYYVITPYLPEPIFKESKAETKEVKEVKEVPDGTKEK